MNNQFILTHIINNYFRTLHTTTTPSHLNHSLPRLKTTPHKISLTSIAHHCTQNHLTQNIYICITNLKPTPSFTSFSSLSSSSLILLPEQYRRESPSSRPPTTPPLPAYNCTGSLRTRIRSTASSWVIKSPSCLGTYRTRGQTRSSTSPSRTIRPRLVWAVVGGVGRWMCMHSCVSCECGTWVFMHGCVRCECGT